MRWSIMGRVAACAAAVFAVALPAAGQRPVVYVPPSSVEQSFDVGIRPHTNHLILFGTPQGGLGVGGGMSPAQVRSFYGMPSSGGANVIAIVDAFDEGAALSDFNTFSAQYGLAQETSTSVTSNKNKVFQVVYQGSKKPRGNTGWSQEEALDIEWAHAMAPSAKVILFEANTNSFSNLFGTVDKASGYVDGNGHAVREVSMSWSGSEFSGETADDAHFTHSGVVYFAAAGDSGCVSGYPAFSPDVLAAGGTSVATDSAGNFVSESGWSSGGGGDSIYESKPAFQAGVANTGSNRSVPDLSSDSDPNTGVSVFWHGGWYIFGGTSVATPCLAGMVNVSGSFRSGSAAELSTIYAGLGTALFRDITVGSSGASCPCLVGWDFNTGVGTPQGTGGM